MFPDDVAANVQTEAGPLPFGFRGKEGIENAVAQFIGDPGTGIANLQLDMALAMAPGRDRDSPPSRHRLDGIHQQIDHDLLEFG